VTGELRQCSCARAISLLKTTGGPTADGLAFPPVLQNVTVQSGLRACW
jgi:hypothetical protein